MITVQQFRNNFPEFSSTVTYPTSMIEFWRGIAYDLLNASRWGRQLDLGAQLFIAHYIVIEARNQAQAAGGGFPGQASSVIASGSVDKVSISYDNNFGLIQDAGHWNQTNYGTRFYALMRMFGAGPVQIGTGGPAPTGTSGQAWTGVIYSNSN